MIPQPLPRSNGPILACRVLDFFHGRTVLSGGIIQIRDVMAEPDFWQAGRDLGVQSMMGVPLLRDGRVIGVIGLSKQETGGFDDTQVALTLIETFAEQAARDRRRGDAAGVAPAHRRPSGIAGIPDRHQRRAEGHQPLDLRSATGARYAGRDRRTALQCRDGSDRAPRGRSVEISGELRVSTGIRGVPKSARSLST